MSRTGFADPNGNTKRGTTSMGSFRRPDPRDSQAFVPAYIQEQRKSELNELRQALNDAINSRQAPVITLALERVIGSMTVGMDVAELFHTVIMASRTNDLIQKKMVYLYLTHYAAANESLALLAVNSMVLDTHDDSPMIRGLALRHLTALRVPSLVEHMLEPLKRGLVDINNYVRRAAALGCAKIFHMSPDPIRDPAIINKLYELLRDADPIVIINAIRALDSILEADGGMAVNEKIVLHLLSKLNEFNEWGQMTILKLIEKYSPKNEEELFAIMNVLDPRFQSRSVGLITAIIHLFLTYTSNYPDLRSHVYARIKALDPLLSLLIGVPPESQYITCSHILLIAKRAPGLFVEEIKLFYPRERDPEYLKLLKVKLTLQFTTEANGRDVIRELAYASLQREILMFTECVRAIGKIAMKLPTISEVALESLLKFLEMTQLNHIMDATLDVMKDLLRRFPDSAQDIVPRLTAPLESVETPEAISAIVSMIGDYGHIIEDSPYVLEGVVDKWETHERLSHFKSGKVRAQLLVGTLKLFFKRPLETKPILGKLLVRATEDYSNPDVHDRALFYFRLLKTDIELCKRVVTSTSSLVNTFFTEDQDAVEVDRLFEQFSSLAVVYGKPAELFVQESRRILDEEMGEAYVSDYDDDSIPRYYENIYSPMPPEAYEQPFSDGYGSTLLDSAPPFTLSSNPTIDPPKFEAEWKKQQITERVESQLGVGFIDSRQFDALFRSNNLRSVAHGGNAAALRFFLYALEASGNPLYVELNLNLNQNTFIANIKSPSTDAAQQLGALLMQLLSSPH